jgi:predicted RNA methylase
MLCAGRCVVDPAITVGSIDTAALSQNARRVLAIDIDPRTLELA